MLRNVTVPAAAAGGPTPGRVPMAEFSARQVVVIAAVAGALVGGAVAGGVAVGRPAASHSTASSSGGSSRSPPRRWCGPPSPTRCRSAAPSATTAPTPSPPCAGAGASTPGCRRSGEVIRQDQPVYSVSNEPVPLLYGSVAAYRAFYVGMSDGADVGELTHDLIALGYGAGLTQSNHYSSATAAAVRTLAERARPAGDRRDPARRGGLRARPHPGHVGHAVGRRAPVAAAAGGGGTVLTATSTTPIVTVDLDVTQEYLVKPGDAVSVVLPDGTSRWAGTSRRSATWPPARAAAARHRTASASGSARPVAVRVQRARQRRRRRR